MNLPGMNLPQLNALLRDQLTAEQQVMTALLDLIRQEQHLLMANSVDNLPHIVEQKAQSIAQLANLAHQRHAMLGTHHYPASEAGMTAYLDQYPDPALTTLWHALLAQVREAKDLNQANGLVINTQLNRNRQALNVLSGAAGLNALYGPGGQPGKPKLSRGYVIG